MNLPAEWRYAGYEDPFALYTDGKLVVSFQMFQPNKGEVTRHAAVSRIDARRPTNTDLDKVKKAFFDAGHGYVEENNKIYACSDLVRNLWQKVEVSLIDGEILTADMKARMQKAGNA